MSATGLFSAEISGTSENANPDFPQNRLQPGSIAPSPMRCRACAEVVIIDGSVGDIGALVAGAHENAQVFILNAHEDGARQIADVLGRNGLHGLAAIHIVAHGDPGVLRIGSTVLNRDNLDAAAPLSAIGAALAPQGEIRLYGCSVGRGAAGRDFIAALSELTGAVVAAATHVVGGASVESWNLDIGTGQVSARMPFAAAALNEYRPTLTISGQLWYTILDIPGPNPGGTNPRRVGGFVNSDGTSFTPTGAFLNPGSTIPVSSGFVTTAFNIAVDTAAGLMFVADTDGLSVSVYNINTHALIQTLQVGNQNAAGTGDDDVVVAVAVDPINHVLFVNRWDSDTAHTGIVKISYNPTAATNPLNLNGAYNSGAQQFLVTNASTGNNYTNATNFEIDIATHKLYYTDWDNGYSLAPFTPTNAIYVVSDYTSGSPTVTKLTSQAQFPTNYSNGFIGNIAVDDAKGLIYFTTLDYNDPGQGHIWWMPINGGTATKIMDLDNLNLGGAPTGLSLDPVTQQLYISLAWYDPPGAVAPTANANKVLVYQLSADGHSFSSLVASYTLDQLEGQPSSNSPGVGGAHPGGSVWNQLPVLTVSGTGTHAGEQGGAITLANSFTSSDADGGYYSRATVQITGGTFSSNESSTADDHLFVQDGGVQRISGTFTGTSIVVSYDVATEKLTLSGYDTIAHYNTVMAALRFNSTGDNPTNYGANTTRTLTWTVSDGSLNVTAGQGQNSGTTTIIIDAVNDAPVNHLPGANPAGNEDATFAITGISVTDVDANPATQSIIVALSVLHGKLTIRTDVAGGVTAANVVGNGTNTITLTGTQNAINATLANATGLQYLGDANFNTSATTETLTITSNDQGNIGSGGALQTQNSVGITVNAVDDAPVNTVPGAQTVSEDTNLVLSSAISVADLDVNETASPNNTVQVTLTVLHGALTLGSTANISFSAGDGTADATMTFTGKLVDVNNALSSVTYRGNQDYNGTNEQLTVTTSDLGHSGSGGPLTDTDIVAITVSGINDAPVTVPSNGATASLTAINEDTATPSGQTVATIIGSVFSDAADNQAANGGSSANTLAGIAITSNAATSEGVWQYSTNSGANWTTISSSATAASALLIAANASTLIRFVPALDFNGPAPALTAFLIDSSGGAVTTGNTVNLSLGSSVGGSTQYSAAAVAIGETINAVNDPPVVDLNGGGAGNDATAAFTEQTPVTIAPSATITDIDNANMLSLTATLTARPDGNAVESLLLSSAAQTAATNAGLTVGYTAATGVLLISGSATKAVYQTILDGIQYNNTSDTPTTTARTVNVVVNDGADNSVLHSVNISVTPVNDAPVVDLNGGGAGNDATAAFAEQTPLAIAPSAAIADADSANLVSLTATLTARPDGDGVESLALSGAAQTAATNAGLTVGYTPGTGVLLITGSATQAVYQTILDGIQYNNTSDTPTTTDRTVNVVVNDGTDNSVMQHVTIGVTAVNDVPVVDLNGAGGGNDATASFTEQTALTIAPVATLTDLDTANMVSLTATLTTLPDGALESLSLSAAAQTAATNAGLVVGYTPGTGVLLITGAATKAVYQTILDGIQYNNTSDTPTTTDRNVDVVVNDGTSNSVTQHVTIGVTALNDTPVNTVPGAQSVAPGVDIVFSTANGNAITIADADDGGLDMTVTLAVTNGGTLTLGSTLNLTSFTDNAASITLTGSKANINTALQGLTYHTPAAAGTHVLTVTTNDNGHTGTDPGLTGDGTSEQDQDTVTLNVVSPVTLDLDTDDSSGATGVDYRTVFAGAAVAVTDADITVASATQLTTATISITGNFQSGEDVLAFTNTANITVVSNTGGVLTLTSANATAAEWAAALASVTYNDTGVTNAGARTIDVVIGDGTSNSLVAHTTVYFHAVDLNGAAAGFDNTASFVEPGPILVAPAATISGLDDLTSMTVTLTTRPDGDAVESLSLNATAQAAAAGLTVTYTDNTGVLLITGAGTIPQATLQTILEGIQYNNSSDNPTTAARTITVTVADAAANASLVHSATVSVTPSNDSPTAVVDIGSAGENETKSFDVLLNDTDPDNGDTRTLASIDSVAAVVSLNGDVNGINASSAFSIVGNQIRFTPGTLFDRLDFDDTASVVVTYTMHDSANVTSTSTLTLTVNGVNDAPVASVDVDSAGENETKSFDVVANDADVDTGDAKTLDTTLGTITVTSANGDVNNINAAGAFSVVGNQILFTPGALFDKLDFNDAATVVVNYTMRDSQNAASSSTLTLTVNGANDAPVANADTGSAGENETKSFDVVANDTEVDTGDTKTLDTALTVDAVTSANGQVNGIDASAAFSVVGNQVVFAPGALFDHLAAGESADVVVHYSMHDSQGASSSSTLTLTVNGVNDAPVASTDTGSAGENETKSFDVVANDTDVDTGDTKTLDTALGVITVTSANGDVNNINAAAAFSVVGNQIQFSPGALFDKLDFDDAATVVVNYTMRDGQNAPSSSTLTLTVNGANDAPVANADTGTAGENETKSFDVVANDAEVDTGDGKTLDATLGAILVTSGNGQINGIDASAAFTVVGNQILFTPGTLFDRLAAGESASVVVNYTMHDGQNASSSSTLTLTVNGANDAPVLVNVAPSAAWPPGSAPVTLSPGTLPSPLDMTDVDNTNLAGATVKLTNSTLLGDTLAVDLPMSGGVFTGTNISAVYNAGNFTLTLSGSDTLANYELVLQHVTFTSTNLNPTSGGGSATRTVAWQLNDGSGVNNLSNVVTSEIRLHTLDLDADDSTALATGYATTFTEHGSAVFIAGDSAADITISDVDLTAGQKITSATVTLTNAKAGDSLAVLGALAGGIISVIDTSVAGQITLTLSGGSATGAASIADYQTALHQIQFANSSDNPDTTQRVISVVVRDSLNIDTNAAISTVSIIPVNDAPVVNSGAASLAYIENQAPTAIDPGLDLTDPDSVNLVGATISFTANFHSGQDILGFTNRNGITGSYNAIAGILTLSGTASVALYEAALQSVTYFNASDAPSGDVRTIGFTVDDGSPQNHASNVGTATVTVFPVNDAPVLNGVPAAAAYTNGPALILAPGLTISDLDSGTLTSATVHVGAGAFVGHGDVLAVSAADLAGTNILASYNAATETLTLSGTDTLAHYQQALEHVTFQTTNFGLDRAQTIEWQLNDGAASNNLSALATTAISLPRPPANDFSGDGHSDILWQNRDGSPAVWAVDGTSLVSGSNVGFNPGADWHVIGSGDFNGDGKSDILWQNTNGTIAEWFLNGASLISGGSVAFNPGSAWHAIGAGDFNGDGKSDILWQNADGTPAVWLMDGLNILSGANVGFNPGPAWHVIGAGDFDGDGKSDILWQNADGTPAVWLMDGTNLLSGSNVGFNPGSAWHAISAGDFNGDGKADILWQNADGTPAVWLMNGTSLISGADVGFNPGTAWHALNTGDYNADGKADILWQNTDGTPAVWLMDGTSLISGANVGFNPGSNWHVIPHHDSLLGG